jgi:hypothetical protein
MLVTYFLSGPLQIRLLTQPRSVPILWPVPVPSASHSTHPFSWTHTAPAGPGWPRWPHLAAWSQLE